MKWIFKSVLAMLVLLPSLILAGEQQVDATGYGQHHNQAIANALTQALRQVTGVGIDSREVVQSLSGRVSTSNNDGEHNDTTFAVSRSGNLSLKTRGVVSRYDVNDVSEQDDGSYRADVTVYVARYEKPGFKASSRRTLAVLPFHTDKPSFSLLGDKTLASKVEAKLRNHIMNQFTQSRRVNVLDREFGNEFKAERNLWLSDDAGLAERTRVGNVLGADYLVVGNIRSINSRKHSKTLTLTGETITHYSGQASIDYKIILAATRQVKWSDSINIKFSDKQVRDLLKKYGSSEVGITTTLARELAQKALSNIYPMRVVAVKGKTIVINQGGKTLKKGEMLDVYLLGEEMFDSYSGESLGQLEEQIATIKVVRINAKTTYAKVVNGDAELIEKDFIVRR